MISLNLSGRPVAITSPNQIKVLALLRQRRPIDEGWTRGGQVLELCGFDGPKSGTGYAALYVAEERGLVESRWEGDEPYVPGRARARLYRITNDGLRVLEVSTQ